MSKGNLMNPFTQQSRALGEVHAVMQCEAVLDECPDFIEIKVRVFD